MVAYLYTIFLLNSTLKVDISTVILRKIWETPCVLFFLNRRLENFTSIRRFFLIQPRYSATYRLDAAAVGVTGSTTYFIYVVYPRSNGWKYDVSPHLLTRVTSPFLIIVLVRNHRVTTMFYHNDIQ